MSGIARGAAWMVGLRIVDRALGLISTIVLARLLVPADFGLIAMTMTFIALIELAGAFSFEIALIQNPHPTRAQYDTAWTLNLCFAFMCATLIALLAPVAAAFYAEPRLTLVMLAFAALWTISGFDNIGTVNFRREMDFGREFRFMLGRRIAGFVVTISCALLFRSYWALVAGQAASRAAGLWLSYSMSSYRPRLSFAARRDLFSFSSWLLISNVLGFALSRLTHFVVGRVHGAGALGLYTMSAELARMPSSELSAPINRAVLPGLSRVNQDLAKWRQVYLDVFATTVALSLPASIGLAMLAGVLIDVVLGPKWVESAPLMVILAVAGAIEAATSNSGVAYLSLGRSRMVAIISAIKLSVLAIGALVLSPLYGLIGVALAELLASVVTGCFSTPVLMRAVGLRGRDVLGAVWRPIVSTAVMTACLYALAGWPFDPPAGDHHGWAWLLQCIAAGAATYVATTGVLWHLCGQPDGPERHALTHAQALWGRLRRQAA